MNFKSDHFKNLNQPTLISSVLFKRLVKIAIGVAFAIPAFFLTGVVGIRSTDYQQELATIEAIAGYQSPGDPKALFKNAYYYFLKSSLTGSRRDMEKAGAAFDQALAGRPLSADLYLLHAAFDLKLHRLEAAKTDLEKLGFMNEDPKVQVLKADIAVQEGDYDVAATLYRQIIEQNRLWDNLSRLAYLQAKSGDFDDADRLYREAEEEQSAKDMRSYAWVELQRGYLALSRGQNQVAWNHYQQADQAYSGYWLTKEYMAEWLGAQRNYDAAVVLYKQIIAAIPNLKPYVSTGNSIPPFSINCIRCCQLSKGIN